MSRADQLLAQYHTKIAKSGQWIAIRRYTGPAGINRAFTDTVTKAFVKEQDETPLVGDVRRVNLNAIALVDTLTAILPVIDSDILVTEFEVVNDVATIVGNKVVGGKEAAIKTPKRRVVGATLIALEISTVS